jgi:transcription termination factor Rho
MAKEPSKTGAKRGRPPKIRPQEEELPLGPASQEEDAARKAHHRPISSAEETPENSLEEVMPVPAATPQEVILKEMNIKPGELPEDIDEEELPPVSSQEMANALDTSILQAKGIHELNEMARELGIENFGTLKKHELIFQILQRNARRSGVIISDGVLEVLPDGFGFLRSQTFNYLPCPEDIYVSPSQIRRFNLQTGNLVTHPLSQR